MRYEALYFLHLYSAREQMKRRKLNKNNLPKHGTFFFLILEEVEKLKSRWGEELVGNYTGYLN